jgi:phage portal protein BeeE
MIELHQLTDEQMEDEEIQDLITAWADARTPPNGAVGFTDNRVEVRVHGTVSADMFENARNAAVLDEARLTGVPAGILDGSQSTASLTYSTQEGRRNEFLDYSLAQFLDPIEARLSPDDVSGPGRVIRFDRSSLTALAAPAITEPQED